MKGGEIMKRWRIGLLCLISTIFLSVDVKPVLSADEQALKPRVPADKLTEVKGLTNRVSENTEALEEGKEVFLRMQIGRRPGLMVRYSGQLPMGRIMA